MSAAESLRTATLRITPMELDDGTFGVAAAITGLLTMDEVDSVAKELVRLLCAEDEVLH